MADKLLTQALASLTKYREDTKDNSFLSAELSIKERIEQTKRGDLIKFYNKKMNLDLTAYHDLALNLYIIKTQQGHIRTKRTFETKEEWLEILNNYRKLYLENTNVV